MGSFWKYVFSPMCQAMTLEECRMSNGECRMEGKNAETQGGKTFAATRPSLDDTRENARTLDF